MTALENDVKVTHWQSFKHRVMWNTLTGRVSRYIITRIGLLFLRIARRMFRWSLGRCSWCGRNCGMSSTISAKGMRCDFGYNQNCRDMK